MWCDGWKPGFLVCFFLSCSSCGSESWAGQIPQHPDSDGVEEKHPTSTI